MRPFSHFPHPHAIISRHQKTVYDGFTYFCIWLVSLNLLFMRFFHLIARGCRLVIWIMTSLGLLWMMLLYICLCTDFCDEMHEFVLGLCSRERWLIHGICTCSVQVDSVKQFSRVFVPMYIPFLVREHAGCQHLVLRIPSLNFGLSDECALWF